MTNRSRVVCLIAVAIAATAAAVWWFGFYRSQWFLQQSRAAYKRGDWRTAADRARQRLERRPDDHDALSLLARSTIQLGQQEAAQDAYQKLGPEAMESVDFFLLAMALERQGQAQQSWDVLERVNPDDLAEPEWLHKLARMYAQGDRLERAAEVAARLADTPGWEVAGNVLLGMVRYEQGDPALAKRAFTRAIERDSQQSSGPVSPMGIRKLLARTLLQVEQPAEARQSLSPLRLPNSDPEVHWLTSRAFLQEGLIDEADQAMDRAGDYAATAALVPEPAPYVGSKRCAECHKSIYDAQQNSRHSQTFRLAAQVDSFAITDEPVPDSHDASVTHRWRRDEGGIHMQTLAGGQSFDSALRYVIGSGRHSLTPVTCDTAGQILECRLSFYGRGAIWFKTDGQTDQPGGAEQYLGRPLGDDALRRCLHCHATSARAVLTQSGPEADDRGIGCERCHGPGGHHVQAMALSFSDLAIARPQLASHEQRVRLCGQCHSPRTGSVPLNDVTVVRFQAATLVQSRCYTESKKLDCMTCHNPHGNVESSVAHYESKCLTCHSSATSADDVAPSPATASAAGAARRRPTTAGDRSRPTACPVSPTSDCIRCHMPVVENAMSYTSFTDHLIRVNRQPSAQPPRR